MRLRQRPHHGKQSYVPHACLLCAALVVFVGPSMLSRSHVTSKGNDAGLVSRGRARAVLRGSAHAQVDRAEKVYPPTVAVSANVPVTSTAHFPTTMSSLPAKTATTGVQATRQPGLDTHPLPGKASQTPTHQQAPLSYDLPRNMHAREVEMAIDALETVGACYDGRPMLSDMPDRVCSTLVCLWSPVTGAAFDMERQPFAIMRGSAPCLQPLGGQLGLGPQQRPVVSFILTVHNGFESAAQVLLELFRTAHEVESAEYVVVDDGSTEDDGALTNMVALLRGLFDVRIINIRHDQSVGFGAANDAGIQAASGNYIVMVNSDMFVAKGWLFALLQTMKADPNAGMVGPMFIGNNGCTTASKNGCTYRLTLQEGGGIVWRDGSAANFGRGIDLVDVDDHANYMRPVDYVSAACLLMKRDTYLSIGGFDPRYELGYYEDTDLAMSVRAAGITVVYQPLAVVYHQEGGTFGGDESPRKQRLMAANRAKFVDKWAHQLQDHDAAGTPAAASARRLLGPSILIVDDILPEPDRDSGSVRAVNLMRILVKHGFGVALQVLVRNDSPFYGSQPRFDGVNVLPVRQMRAWKLSQDGKCAYDAAIVCRRDVTIHTLLNIKLACPRMPIIYDTVDIHFLREARLALTKDLADATWDFSRMSVQGIVRWLDAANDASAGVRLARDTELALMGMTNTTWVVSQTEKDALQMLSSPKPVYVVSNIHDMPPRLADSTPCDRRSGALFVGNMYHEPNQQAIIVLLRDVLPRIMAGLPTAARDAFTMHIVGANTLPDSVAKAVAALIKDTPYVKFHGYMSDADLKQLYRSVRVALMPLLTGAGVKGKVNEAMKLGTPVVTTPIAAEGMHIVDGVHGMVASSVDEFADKALRLYQGCNDVWNGLAVEAFQLMQTHFSVDAVEPVVLRSINDLGLKQRRP